MRNQCLRVLTITAFVLHPSAGRAAELHPQTVAAFDRYVALTEQRMSRGPFLLLDGLSPAGKTAAMTTLKGGELRIDSLTTLDQGREIDVPDGLIHHWIGDAFVPGVSASDVAALLQDYNRHADIYRPTVSASKLRSRTGDTFLFYLRFTMKKVITVVVNSEHRAVFTRPAPDRIEGRIRSLRIAEVENAGTPQEREKPVGNDGGYLWRLNTYWRLQERDGGTYIECESVSLTRGIPTGFGWMVKPFVTSIPRESLTFTLRTTQEHLSASKR